MNDASGSGNNTGDDEEDKILEEKSDDPNDTNINGSNSISIGNYPTRVTRTSSRKGAVADGTINPAPGPQNQAKPN